MNKYLRPVKKELPPLSLALAKCRLDEFSFLDGMDNFELLGAPRGLKSYYGEQMFSMIANGVLKRFDSTTAGRILKFAQKDVGFDVKYTDFAGTHFIEVKTIWEGKIYPLSAQQDRIADYIAIYNPRYKMQSFEFRHKTYEIPANSYLIVKLH